MLAKFFVCVALVSMATAWKWGGCPKYTVMENFDVQRYLGNWHEAARLESIPFESGDCVYAQYTPIDDTYIEVKNTEIQPDGKINQAIGKAYEKGNAYLKVSFFWPFYGDYKVLDTDYTDYSVVYSCSDWWIAHEEFAWILSRDRGYSAANSDELALLESIGVSESEMILHNLSECPRDAPVPEE